MPRVRKRISTRGVSPDVLKRASDRVLEARMSIRAVAREFNICHVTLNRYCKKRANLAEQLSADLPKVGYRSAAKVFTEEQENNLREHLVKGAQMYDGFTPCEVRKFAYQLAVQYACKFPPSWAVNEMAGAEWFTSFMQRSNLLFLRRHRPGGLSSTVSFTQTNVSTFFDNLEEVLKLHKFQAKDIWNVGEMGITTAKKPDHMVPLRAMRQETMSLSERSAVVTVTLAVNALGGYVPPAFLFPRKQFKEYFVTDGPPGCIGIANECGLMRDEDFLVFMSHFANYTKVSAESKVLLLLDNHNSHLSALCLDFCKEVGIVLLSIPKHWSHKLQPLDRGVYPCFKAAVNSMCENLARRKPRKRMAVYDVPAIVNVVLPVAASTEHVQMGFSCCGIWPFNRHIFQDIEYVHTKRNGAQEEPSTSALLLST